MNTVKEHIKTLKIQRKTNKNIKNQIKKGKELAISAFLLITIYGIIIIKIGKIKLPHLINLERTSDEYLLPHLPLYPLQLLSRVLEGTALRSYLLQHRPQHEAHQK